LIGRRAALHAHGHADLPEYGGEGERRVRYRCTMCYCCYSCSVVSSRKCQKNRVIPENTRGFPGIFSGITRALDAGDRRGLLVGLPSHCSAGLTLATVVGQPNCCSVVTVNTSNTVQLLTFDSSRPSRDRRALWPLGLASRRRYTYTALARTLDSRLF